MAVAQVIQFPTTNPTSDESIIEGAVRFWKETKARASQDREGWRMIGQALLIGRKLHPSDKLFGQWCREQGFDMDRFCRANAAWLAENWSTVQSLHSSCAHPTAIRAAYNAALAGEKDEEAEEGAKVPATAASTPSKPPAASSGATPAPAPAAVVPPWEDLPGEGGDDEGALSALPVAPAVPDIDPATWVRPGFNQALVGQSIASAALETEIFDALMDEDAMADLLLQDMQARKANAKYVAKLHRVLGKVLSKM